MESKPSFSTSEVAEYCHVTPDTIRKWAEAGRIQVFKTPGGHRRIRREELVRFLRENAIPLHSDLCSGGLKILLVDDEDTSSLGVIRRFLERSGKSFQVETATDAFEAGYRVATFKPDVLFVSARLSGLDGGDLCRRIKSVPEHANIHVILLTDSTDGTRAERATDQGVAAILRKPFTPDDMRRTLAKVGLEVS
jgi:excisionase family DNA binding protein